MATRIEPTVGISADGWVSLGVVTRAHGIKGALKVRSWAEGLSRNRDSPPAREAELGGGPASGCAGAGEGLQQTLLNTEQQGVLRAGLEVRLGGRVHRVAGYAPGVLTLDDVADRDAADALRGVELFVRRADFPADPASVYLVDLIGAAVVDEAGRALGTVEGFSDNGAQPLLSVARPGGSSVLVPFVPALVRSADKGRVVLSPPPGLFVESDALE